MHCDRYGKKLDVIIFVVANAQTSMVEMFAKIINDF